MSEHFQQCHTVCILPQASILPQGTTERWRNVLGSLCRKSCLQHCHCCLVGVSQRQCKLHCTHCKLGTSILRPPCNAVLLSRTKDLSPTKSKLVQAARSITRGWIIAKLRTASTSMSVLQSKRLCLFPGQQSTNLPQWTSPQQKPRSLTLGSLVRQQSQRRMHIGVSNLDTSDITRSFRRTCLQQEQRLFKQRVALTNFKAWSRQCPVCMPQSFTATSR